MGSAPAPGMNNFVPGGDVNGAGLPALPNAAPGLGKKIVEFEILAR
jgi:hypothetical protein